MIVKMLTHVHMLDHTLWCWHTLRRRWSLKGRERMGSSLPLRFGAFEKMKCIFSIASVGTLEKSWECSSLRNTHRTLAVEAPDAEAVRPVCCGARVKHRTVSTGCRVAPVYASGAI